MTANWQLDRRTFLRGAGTAIALPFLNAMAPSLARGEVAPAPPVRMAFLFVPNGMIMRHWTPTTEGSDFTLSPTLEPLAPWRDELLVLSGLAHAKAMANGDGGGDHARSAATFLTGCQARKTAGKDIRAGVSVDQVAAAKIGAATKLPSLEIGCQPGRLAGTCDSGYSCAYTNSISWKSESTPMPKEVDPRAVFDRLFSDGGEASGAAQIPWDARQRQSILDFAQTDAKRLAGRLGQSDRHKLDEYLTSVRELERRLNRDVDDVTLPGLAGQAPVPPKGVPGEFATHAKLLGDLLALAFQLDLTRVATFMLADEGSGRSYRSIDVPEGHHELSHHQGDETKIEKIARIDRFHIELFAHFLDKLKSTPDGEGTLLDQAMILYGCAISDGNKHRHEDLPILLAGRGAGTLAPGRHIRYEAGTPMMNLHLSLLDRVGAGGVESLGDSTGRLPGLDG